MSGNVANFLKQSELPWRFSFTKPFKNPIKWYNDTRFYDLIGHIRRNMLLSSGSYRAKQILRHPVYQFPQFFLRDAQQSWLDWLRDAEKGNLEPSTLLNREWNMAYQQLVGTKGTSLQFKVDNSNSIIPQIAGYRFIYGPNVPTSSSEYTIQHWVDMIKLIVPKDEADFVDHKRQRLVYDKACTEGAVVQIRVRFPKPVTLTVTNSAGSFSDSQFCDVWFTSPHIHPRAEIFSFIVRPDSSANELDGDYTLRWKWRVTDINDIIEERYGNEYGKSVSVPILL